MTEEPGMLQSMGSQRIGHDLATNNNNMLRSGVAGSYGGFGEENGNPFQYSCLGNPMDVDKGVWQATQSMGLQRVGHNLATKQQQYTILIE